jgi:small-conductance mechanosensitive channel
LEFASGNQAHVQWFSNHPVVIFGTIGILLLSGVLYYSYLSYLKRSIKNRNEEFRRRNAFKTLLFICTAAIITVLWARLLQHTGTFLGILGAGLAVALREPLLSIAGRVAILAGHMYSLGDRIQLNRVSGDVIDIGFFYTRLMEIGNWISADQVTGRIVQMPNSQVFGTAIFNYTQNFSYIWDEIKLPITYSSNLEAASEILVQAGGEYTREFLKGAESQLEQMRRNSLVPEFDLKPTVFLKITDNWLELIMRYVVDPKQRRNASNFIALGTFKKLRERQDIQIASETMDLTVQTKKAA